MTIKKLAFLVTTAAATIALSLLLLQSSAGGTLRRIFATDSSSPRCLDGDAVVMWCSLDTLDTATSIVSSSFRLPCTG